LTATNGENGTGFGQLKDHTGTPKRWTLYWETQQISIEILFVFLKINGFDAGNRFCFVNLA
jgi:hypothetical protein